MKSGSPYVEQVVIGYSDVFIAITVGIHATARRSETPPSAPPAMSNSVSDLPEFTSEFSSHDMRHLLSGTTDINVALVQDRGHALVFDPSVLEAQERTALLF